jgi:hypothetical protein
MTIDLHDLIMNGYLDSTIIRELDLDKLSEEELRHCLEALLYEFLDLQHQLDVLRAKNGEGGDLCDELESVYG